MQSFKRKKVHFLSMLAREKRLVRSKELLSRYATGDLKNIIFSISKSISEIPDRSRYVDRKMKPLSVMVWAGMSAIGRTSLIRISISCISSYYYCMYVFGQIQLWFQRMSSHLVSLLQFHLCIYNFKQGRRSRFGIVKYC